MKETIKIGDIIISKVTIPGSKNAGWRYAFYKASTCKSGYLFDGYATDIFYPSEKSFRISSEFENNVKKDLIFVICGRPIQGENAPLVAE